MTRTWIITALALAGAAPLNLAAQRPEPAPRARTPRPDRTYAFSFSSNHGRIGVLVNTTADSASDRYGARIEAVTPGGPAEKAGLKAGDIITKFNGTSLAYSRDESSELDNMSRPGGKLVDLAHELDPGDTVKIEFRRGAETKTATLIADEGAFTMNGMGPMVHEMELPRTPFALGEGDGMGMGMGMGMGFCMGDAWCDLDLVTLNADLGDYFGTKEGVLVVKAPADSELPLKSGDVILSIGGRKPTSPSHAMRILRSYDTGETVSIEIMRHQKRSTISWTVPEGNRGWRVRQRNKGEQSMWILPNESTEQLRVLQEDARRALEQSRDQARRSVDESRQELERMRRQLQDMVKRQRAANAQI
jgi:PDZ domain-containing protein